MAKRTGDILSWIALALIAAFVVFTLWRSVPAHADEEIIAVQDEVRATWQPNPEPDVQGYSVYMRDLENIDAWTRIYETTGTEMIWPIPEGEEEQFRMFAITAHDFFYESPMSNPSKPVWLDGGIAPGAPTGFQVTNGFSITYVKNLVINY